ncbi:MAG: hypothetical protein ACMVO5_13585 [Polymorphobacter sp.]|uniref:hypothetical protein n=1 Tax=Polymorphobacter sp. TaxID=1909290 RepID=UPI003A89A45E
MVPSPTPSTSPSSSHEATRAAWRQFRALIGWSALAGLLAGLGAIFWVWSRGTVPGLHMMVAMGGGIFLALLLGGALMGLVFVSARLGHDEEVASLDDDIF